MPVTPNLVGNMWKQHNPTAALAYSQWQPAKYFDTAACTSQNCFDINKQPALINKCKGLKIMTRSVIFWKKKKAFMWIF